MERKIGKSMEFQIISMEKKVNAWAGKYKIEMETHAEHQDLLFA